MKNQKKGNFAKEDPKKDHSEQEDLTKDNSGKA